MHTYASHNTHTHIHTHTYASHNTHIRITHTHTHMPIGYTRESGAEAVASGKADLVAYGR